MNSEFLKLENQIKNEKDLLKKCDLIHNQIHSIQKLKESSKDTSHFYLERSLKNFSRLQENVNLIDQTSNCISSNVVKKLKERGLSFRDASNMSNDTDIKLEDISLPERKTFQFPDSSEFFLKFKSFSSHLDLMNESLDISKTFATPKVDKKSEDKRIVENIRKPVEPIELSQESDKNLGYTSARYELFKQNQKQGKDNSKAENPLFSYGNNKKTLGSRRGGRNPFVPPVRNKPNE